MQLPITLGFSSSHLPQPEKPPWLLWPTLSQTRIVSLNIHSPSAFSFYAILRTIPGLHRHELEIEIEHCFYGTLRWKAKC